MVKSALLNVMIHGRTCVQNGGNYTQIEKRMISYCLKCIIMYYVLCIMYYTKFLGVIIDNKLKWNDHITYVKSKICKIIGLFYKMRQYLGRTALVNLYYSLVFPYLIYCNEIWGNASSVHLDPIIKIKRCVRIITYADYLSSSEPICQTLNILNVRELVVQRFSLLMFKIYKSDVPKPINILFRKNNTYHSYNTR